MTTHRLTRRGALVAGFAGAAASAAAAAELVSAGVLPGHSVLDDLDGACSVAPAAVPSRGRGLAVSGRFFSRARGRTVGYTVAYPPGHGPGSRIPLALVLHAFGGTHRSGLGGVDLAQALSQDGLPAFALAAADGGGGYWTPHPGDDPMAMLTDELLPRCRRLGLGRDARVGAIGISMGGYGALLLGEERPELIDVVAAISPAIWTSYAEARAANPTAYASSAAFAAHDAVTHAGRLTRTPVRIAAGTSDPFLPGVRAMIAALPRTDEVAISGGCHDGAFFAAQRPPSLAFLGAHLTAAD